MKSPTMSVKAHFKRLYVVHNHEVLAKWWYYGGHATPKCVTTPVNGKKSWGDK